MQHLQKLNKFDVWDSPMEQVKDLKASKAETQQLKMTVSILESKLKTVSDEKN